MIPIYMKKAWRDLWQDRANIFLIIISISICLTTLATLLNTSKSFSDSLQPGNGQQDSTIYFYTNLFGNKLPELTDIEGITNADARFKTPGRLEINGSQENFELIVLPNHEESINIVPAHPYKSGIYLEKTTMDYFRLKKDDMVSITLPGKAKKEVPVAGYITDYDYIPAKYSGLGRAYISPVSLKTLGLTDDKNSIQITVNSKEYEKNGAEILQNAKNQLKPDEITVYRTESSNDSLLLRQQMTDTVFLLLIILGSLALVLGIILVIHFFYSLTARKIQSMSILKVLGAEKKHLWKEFSVTLGIIGSVIFLVTLLLSAGLSYYFSQYLIEELNIGVFQFEYSKDVLIIITGLSFLVPIVSGIVPITIALKVPIVQGLIHGSRPYRKGGKHKASRFSFFLLSLRNAGKKRIQFITNILMLSFGGAVIIACIGLNNSLTGTVKDMQSFWKHDLEWDIRTSLNISEVTQLAKQSQGVLQAESWTGRSAEAELFSKEKPVSTLLLSVPRESKMIQPAITEGLWLDRLPKTHIVINSDFQALAGNIQTGQSISLKVGNQERTLKIGGVIQGQLNGPVIFMASDDYHSWMPGQQPNRVIVKLDSYGKTYSSVVINNMEQLFNNNKIAIEAFDTVGNMNSRPHEIIDLVVYSLLFTGILFSVVGIVNLITAMSGNVLERTHEIGLIRAVGGPSYKIHQLFIGEGIFIAFISWIISAALSFPLQFILNQKIGESLIHSPLHFSFSPLGVGLWLIMSLIIGCVASIIPAQKAVKQPVKHLIAGK
ncbi:FtsX-like permease family protein [Bacillus sp. CECT 9360]|uniref:ABC transporter permease n=1 Tax=Bacillus sp. CECT 9360 TaxID=2845821 RepID=UPI001E4CEB44|nr:FtsX-like permease family protein [Bacillus sp. CECT 9360]CAH0344248.1 hypothetical protein BCI9360_00491 [Bacillus sp. CECT 9360]